MLQKIRLGLLALALLAALPSWAALSLPPFFSNHMVLQQLRPIRIWGTATPQDSVRIEMQGQSVRVVADAAGKWQGLLLPVPAGGPYQLTVQSGGETRTFTDVLVGEVWLCAGQSNMEWELWRANNGLAEVSNANFPQIRLLEIPKELAMTPQASTPPTQWAVCNPITARSFSAVAYFFGRHLHQNMNVPIGLIEATWGGTGINTWMSGASLADDPLYSSMIAEMPVLDIQAIRDSIAAAQVAWDAQLSVLDIGLQQQWEQSDFAWQGWPTMSIPRTWESGGLPNTDGVVWFKRSFVFPASFGQDSVTVHLGRIEDEDQTYINGHLVGSTPRDPGRLRTYRVPVSLLVAGENVITVRVTDYAYVGGLVGGGQPMRIYAEGWEASLVGNWHYQLGTVELGQRPLELLPNDYPTMIYNGMISPLQPMSIQGVIWYQGETDANSPYYYRDYFRTMIDTWRTEWGIGNIPFLFVQLASFRQPPALPVQSGWATLRESQALALLRPRVGMVTAIDIGDANDIHPLNKQDVGLRLGLAARRIAYREDVVDKGPRWAYTEKENDSIVITFSDVAAGLQSIHGETNLRGFAIAGENGQFVWADAQITGPNKVRVRSAAVPNPRYIRYAWADNPGVLDLYNSAGLPALPFRTDALPVPWQ